VAGEIDLDGDRLTEYLNPASPTFATAVASADLQLTERGHASSSPSPQE